jgi:gamma-glutamyltranspeptidase/glutathione hydrolase
MSAAPLRQRFEFLRRALAVVESAALASCSLLNGSPTLSPVGQVVGDEPQAVEAGATVLAHGGDAVDAPAATYFALAVNDQSQQKAEEFDFLAREPLGGGPYAIPGGPAGIASLQLAYGRLPWQRIVSPAEGFAAAGFSISQALYTRLSSNQDLVRLDAQLAGEFLDEAGHLKPAGATVEAPALAQTLSQLRVHGTGAFYRGAIAEELASYARAQGGGITTNEIAVYQPARSAPLRIPMNGQVAFLPSERVGAGEYTRALLAKLVDSQGQIVDAGHAGAAVASATKATLDFFKLASLPRDLGATGFAAVDPSGQAVSCAVGMNGPFGSGRTAGNSGVVLAAAPKSGEAGLSSAFLAPAIGTADGALTLAGVGAGGPNGTAMITLALRISRVAMI